MSLTEEYAGARGEAWPLGAVSAAAGLAVLAAMLVAAAARAGWVFEYPVDDPYIHLAVAEQIARGGYGVNAGEWASAASSALWPLLLVPGAGAEWGRYLPLAWNVAALVLLCLLWARLLEESGAAARWPRFALAAAVLGPVALNAPGLAFAGMEHTAHAAASLAIVLGLLRLGQGAAGWLLPLALGCLLAPAFRLEGLALAWAAALAVAWLGRPGAALGLGALALVPVAGFAAFLSANGIGPLPSSVIAKMMDGGVGDLSFAARLAQGFAANVTHLPGLVLLALALAGLAAGALLPERRARALALTGALAALAHLALGQIGWLNRYEPYALIAAAAALLVACGLSAGARAGQLAGAVAVAGLVSGAYYTLDFIRVGLWSPRGIHLQQAQMARFVHEVAQVDAAANDIGRLAWRNPHHVLDLWGLASAEARDLRLGEAPAGWAGDLVARDGAPLIALYPQHFGDGIGRDWVVLGDLQLKYERGFLGGGFVRFYAADAQAAATLAPLLTDFAATLPDGVRYFPEGTR